MASTYLTRTPASATNRKTWTFSGWFKIADGSNGRFLVAQTDPSNAVDYTWGSNGEIYLGIYEGGAWKEVITNAKHRDVSAWYHLVIAVDTTQATASDRVKLYVNGNLQTSLATSNYPSQNYDTAINNNVLHRIGAYTNNGLNFNGSMSHIHFIDGTAYDADTFGETDATTGIWKIKTSPSVTYGTNGFFILKDGNSVTDQSGNSNNWTVAGGTLTNTEDNPSNVFATMNPFSTKQSFDTTFTNGNNRFRHSQANEHNSCRSTLGFNSGKWYAEFKVVSDVGITSMMIGIGSLNSLTAPNTTVSGLDGSGYQDNGVVYRSGYSDLTGLTTFSQNDIIGVACDFDNKIIYWYKNGTLLNGTGYAFADNAGIAKEDFYGFAVSGYQESGDDIVVDANFGNGYFGTTAVSTPGTNASGNGIFEYDVPTGYTALSTKGLNL